MFFVVFPFFLVFKPPAARRLSGGPKTRKNRKTRKNDAKIKKNAKNAKSQTLFLVFRPKYQFFVRLPSYFCFFPNSRYECKGSGGGQKSRENEAPGGLGGADPKRTQNALACFYWRKLLFFLNSNQKYSKKLVFFAPGLTNSSRRPK